MSQNKLPGSDLAALAKGKGFGFVPVDEELPADELFVPVAKTRGFGFVPAPPSHPAPPKARRAGRGDRRLPGGKKAAKAHEAAKSKRLAVEPGGLLSARPGISPKGLRVDRRVGIALSVLPAKDRRLVERVIHSRRVFDGILAKSADIQQLETSGRLLYQMAVSPSLQLIFALSGDTVCMEDVVETATLRHFGDQKATKPGRRRSVAARP